MSSLNQCQDWRSKTTKYLNVEEVIYLYEVKKLSLAEVSALTGVSKSTLRLRLIEKGALRTPKDSQILSGKQGKKGAHLIGVPRPVSDKTRLKMSKSKLEWAENNAVGVSKKPCGYMEITRGANKFKREHRVIVEQHIGRKLLKSEVVHHKDNNKTNNLLDNLVIMSISDHSRLHALETLPKRIRSSKGRFV